MQHFLRNKWFTYIAGLAFFFVAVRYYGYHEDAGRYLLQIIHMLYPERFVNDVPFMFGNQDEYTFFSPLIALFFKAFGINYGGIVAVLFIEFLWGFAAITLFSQWAKQFDIKTYTLPLFIICIATLTNVGYGCGAYFPIIDHILVARFFAEVFILLGIAFLWNQNKFISLILFVLAFLFHPLMSVWCFLLWIIFYFPKSFIPLLVFVVLFPLTCLLHIGRFDIFPEDWLGKRLPFTPTGYDAMVYTGILLFWWITWKRTRSINVSRFAGAMFWVVFFGLFWQYVGIASRHQLLVQIQPYRVLWLSFVPMFLVGFFCLRDWSQKELALASLLLQKKKCVKIFFALGGISVAILATLGNLVQLGIEHNIGNVDFAVYAMHLPDKLMFIRVILFCLFAAICFVQRRYWIASIFGISVFNEYLTILPLFGIAFLLIPNLGVQVKKILISLAISCSVLEFLASLQCSPLLDSSLETSILFVVVLLLSLWIVTKEEKVYQCSLYSMIPLLLLVLSFLVYGARHWDVRSELQVLDERQMDQFFDKMVFPQVLDRGKILFVENEEFPLQSRFKFLTGTYADETINIGELFFKGQFLEARKRKNALLLGDSILGDWGNYSERIAKLYSNPDTILDRVRYLCSAGEITHFATDYANMPLQKQDSIFLGVKRKYLWLYECKPL